MSRRRPERVGDLIKQEIATMLLHGELKDSRIGFVTITSVEMTPDLKEARVYFSQMGTEADRKKSADGLNHACGFVRRKLAGLLDLRHIPVISFRFDETLEYSEKIERLIREIKEGEGR